MENASMLHSLYNTDTNKNTDTNTDKNTGTTQTQFEIGSFLTLFGINRYKHTAIRLVTTETPRNYGSSQHRIVIHLVPTTSKIMVLVPIKFKCKD